MALGIDKPILIEPELTSQDIDRCLAILIALYQREEEVIKDEQQSSQAKTIAYNRQPSLSHVAQMVGELKNQIKTSV